MFDDNTYSLIDGYLNGTLSNSNKLDFEKRLKEDSELYEEFIIQKDLFHSLDDNSWAFEEQPNLDEVNTLKTYFESDDAKSIAAAIAKSNTDYQSSKKTVFKLPRFVYPIAASIALILGYFLLFEKNTTTDSLYAEYKNWDDLPSLTVRADDNDNSLTKGQTAFKNKEYKEASAIFNNYLKNNTNPQATTYLGVSYIELEEYELAIKTFNSLLEGQSLDRSKGYWYKSLVYLKLGDKAKALETLNLLLEKESNYKYQLAKALKAKLVKL